MTQMPPDIHKGLAFSGSDSIGFDQFFNDTSRKSASNFEHSKASTFLSNEGSILEHLSYTHDSCPLCNAQACDNFLFNKQGYDHWVCSQCGGIYVNPCLKEEIIYEQVYGSSKYPFVSVVNSTSQSLYDQKRFDDALDIIQKNHQNPAILDLGCGGGGFLDRAQNRGISNLVGCDLLAKAVNVASITCPTAKIYKQSAEDLLLNESTYDVISLWEVLDHVLFPQILLNLVINRLNPGGILLLSMRNAESLAALVLKEKAEMFLGYAHLSFWNKSHFKSIAQLFNLDILDYYTYISYYEPISRELANTNDAFLSLTSLLNPNSILNEDLGYKIVCILRRPI